MSYSKYSVCAQQNPDNSNCQEKHKTVWDIECLILLSSEGGKEEQHVQFV